MKRRSEARARETTEEEAGRWMLDFQAGDDAAFERLVLHYESSVRHFLYRYLRDRDRVEDLTQEVFVRVFRSRGRYEPTARFRTWLFTIATRLALNEIRGVRRRRRLFQPFPEPEDRAGAAPCREGVDHREPSAAERLEESELAELVGELIDDLPETQKAALVLSRVEELSYREIAEALGISEMAVKSLLMRARETLRSRLAGYLRDGKRPPRSPLVPRRKA